MRHYHSSPDVRWPVSGARPLWFVAMTWLLAGAVVLLYWGLASVQPWWVRAALVLGWLGVAAALLRWLRRPAQGVLHWRQGAWHWQPEGASESLPLQAPRVVLDVQGALAVVWYLPQQQRPFFLWLQCRGDAQHWDAVRRAVYSSVSLTPEGA